MKEGGGLASLQREGVALCVEHIAPAPHKVVRVEEKEQVLAGLGEKEAKQCGETRGKEPGSAVRHEARRQAAR